MKVFRIRLDSNNFQSFLPADPKIWDEDVLKMNCRPKLPAWKAPSVYTVNPMLQRGAFFHLCSGAFVADMSACEELRAILEMACELLPLAHLGGHFHLLNVLECVNCLDEKKAEWVFGKTTNARIRIKEYQFDAGHFSESTLFKIPQTASGEVLTVSGLKDPEDEFKPVVERTGLGGILFEELWSGPR